MSAHDEGYIGPQEMAEMHGVAVTTIHRILRADQNRAPEKRRIPGAKRIGSKYRGEWLIPVESARAWKNPGPGRPRNHQD